MIKKYLLVAALKSKGISTIGGKIYGSCQNKYLYLHQIFKKNSYDYSQITSNKKKKFVRQKCEKKSVKQFSEGIDSVDVICSDRLFHSSATRTTKHLTSTRPNSLWDHQECPSWGKHMLVISEKLRNIFRGHVQI